MKKSSQLRSRFKPIGSGGPKRYDIDHLEIDNGSISVSMGILQGKKLTVPLPKIVLNDITFYATLSWKDISSTLRALNTAVVWAQRTHDQNGIGDTDKSFELTTYVLI